MDGEANGGPQAQDAQGAQAREQQGQTEGPQGGQSEVGGAADYEKQIAERGERIAALGAQVAGAAKSAEAATGLPNAEAASDAGRTMKRWRRIAGLEDTEE